MKYGESAFDIIYLVFAVVIGICILRKRRDLIGKLMGCAVLILGFGDAFHLVPRVLNYFIAADFTPWLGVGKLITSITMTVFYLLTYFLWLKVYGKSENKGLSITIYILVAIRIILCLLPQNGWLTGGSDYIWGIIRNIPFVILGGIIVYLYFTTRNENRTFRFISSIKNGFAPDPDETKVADIIYICSPNNPTGAVFTKEKLKKWVDFANEHGSVILFDAAYEAFIEEADVPHSIFEIDGANTCAIEICSLSKTAGFTGTRLGYTVIPKTLTRNGISFNSMWVRNRTTKTNGVSFIIQKGGAAVFTDEGQKEIKENIAYYKENAKILMRVLDECGIEYTGGKNAPYIWLKCPNGLDSWAFFDLLLNEIQVVGTPGEGFGKCGEGFFRFSTFGSREDTLEAANRLKVL